MNQKQNSMFRMCSDNKLPSSFKNESVGLWYDAKSDVTSCIAELKSQIIERKSNLEQVLGIFTEREQVAKPESAT